MAIRRCLAAGSREVFDTLATGYAGTVGDGDLELDTGAILEQGDELLQSSRDLISELNAQLENNAVHNTGENLRNDSGSAGDS